MDKDILDLQLGDKTYRITHPTLFEDARWRKKVMGILSPFISSATEDESGEIQIGKINVRELLPQLATTPLDFVELMFLYSSALENDKKKIQRKVKEGEIREEELLDAAMAVFDFSLDTLKKTFRQIERTTSRMKGMETMELAVSPES